MESARKILFYIFVLLYLILCPLTIFYCFGFIFQPQEKEISQTGLIYLASTPPGADVYLGNSRFAHQTPTAITDLIPGNYQVNVKLKNYRPWSYSITIKPGKSATFKNILLLPTQISEHIIIPGTTFTNLTALTGRDEFVIQKSVHLRDFYLYTMSDNTFKPLIADGENVGNIAVEHLFTEPKSSFIILFGGSLWDKNYYFIDFEHEQNPLKQITELFPKYPTQLIWNNNDRNHIFAIYADSVNRIDLEKMSLYPQYFEKIKGFGVSDQAIYLLETDWAIIRTTPDKKESTPLFADKFFLKELFEKSSFYDIRPLNDNILLFWGTRGDLKTTVTPYHLSDQKIVGLNYLKADKLLLFWSKYSIQMADFNLSDTEGLLFTDRVTIRDVFNKGTDIAQCFWVYNHSHILFRDANNIYLLDLTPGVKNQTEPVTRVKEGTDILYSEKTGILYYINQDGYLADIRILPKDKFIFNTFVTGENQK